MSSILREAAGLPRLFLCKLTSLHLKFARLHSELIIPGIAVNSCALEQARWLRALLRK